MHAGGDQDAQAGYDAAGRVSQGGGHHEATAPPETRGSVCGLLAGRTDPHHHRVDERRLTARLSQKRPRSNDHLDQTHRLRRSSRYTAGRCDHWYSDVPTWPFQ